MKAALRFLVVPAVVGIGAGLVAAKLRFTLPAQAVIFTIAAVFSALLTSIKFSSSTIKPFLSTKEDDLVYFSKEDAVPFRAITEFRRGKNQDTWHFCSNCTFWPTNDYESSSSEPVTGDLCNECSAKFIKRNCAE